MIASYKCDRCGREFQHKGLGFQHYPVVEDTSVPRVTTYGHMCHICAEEFLKWMSPEPTPLTGLRYENNEFKWGTRERD